jgi:putative photosynthetic complex assembly protein
MVFLQAKPEGRKGSDGAARESAIFSPRLIGFMGALCVAALLIAGFGRLTGIGVQKLPVSETVASREIRVLDGGKGVVLVESAADGALLLRLGQGEGGFIRTVIRGLAHERMARGGSSAEPFRLALRADGRLTITDTVTGREIILDSFGGPNRDVFARLLPDGATNKQKAAGAVRTNGGVQ